MKIHFIAIGGSAMHNLAIALKLKGYQISGSDDEIFEPSRSRLKKYDILPDNMGWDKSRISDNLDAIVLGMHAKEDNPELLEAKRIGLKIYSYPEYIYEQTKDKTRVVIGGSHGKTSITSMILHVLGKQNMDYDYMVGAQLEGFECMVKLTESAPIAILEGDEYLSSPIDRRPKFHLYHPDIAVISGIAWDHINVFKTYEDYVRQFEIFTNVIAENGKLIYCELDEEVKKVAEKSKNSLMKIPYGVHPHQIKEGVTYLETKDELLPVEIFGAHNLQNLNAALEVCLQLGVEKSSFYKAIQSFTGASKRLELVAKNEHHAFYKDFAHSPSKLKATTQALKNQYPDRELIACMELHTFSSLTPEFLKLYKNTMDFADRALVYFNPQTVAHKRLKALREEDVKDAFGGENVEVYTDSQKLQHELKQMNWKNTNLLMMSSGNFDGIDFSHLALQLEAF